MIYGFYGLFVFLFLAGALVDEPNERFEQAMGLFWVIVLSALFASVL